MTALSRLLPPSRVAAPRPPRALARLGVLAVLAALLAPAAARADSVDIIRDCQDGRIDGKYSQAALSRALKEIPTDIDEYTNCRQVISRAQLGGGDGGSKSSDSGSGGGAGDGSGTGAGPGGAAGLPLPSANGLTAEQVLEGASPAQRQQLASAISAAGSKPVAVGGERVSPDASAFSPSGEGNSIPTPLVLLLLAVLGSGVGSVVGIAVRRRHSGPGRGAATT